MKPFTYVVGGLCAVVVCLYPLTLEERIAPLVYIAGLALTAFALALISNEWVLAGPGAALLITEYAIALDGAARVDYAAPLLAVGVFVVLEAIDLLALITRRPAPERSVVAGHVRHVLAVIVAGAAVAAAVLLAARVVGGGPEGLAAVAAVCGLLAIVIAVSLAHRAVEGDA